MESGSAIFLSPKCYLLDNGNPNDANGSKRALKGVHHETVLTRQDFLDSLYENRIIVKRQVRLRRHQKAFKMRLIEEHKKALNSVYYKFKVCDDLITCVPHNL